MSVCYARSTARVNFRCMASARQIGQCVHGIGKVVQQHARLHATLYIYCLLILIQLYGEAFRRASLCEPA